MMCLLMVSDDQDKFDSSDKIMVSFFKANISIYFYSLSGNWFDGLLILIYCQSLKLRVLPSFQAPPLSSGDN